MSLQRESNEGRRHRRLRRRAVRLWMRQQAGEMNRSDTKRTPRGMRIINNRLAFAGFLFDYLPDGSAKLRRVQ